MASKSEKSAVANCCDYLHTADKSLKDAVEEFSKLEILKSADSYIFGMIRSLHENVKYVYSVMVDVAGKEVKSMPKTKPVDVQKD